MDDTYKIVSLNKEYLHSESLKITSMNRAFRYGDGFFESMHANGLKVQFIHDHFNRVKKAADFLSLELPDFFTLEFIEKQISGLLSRCKLFQAARVKLTLFRSGEGLYFPETNKAEFLIEANFLGKGSYVLNEKGITIGVYKEIAKPNLPIFHFKSLNAQIYTVAAVYAQKETLDDVLLVNENGFIVEATSSNIFAVKEKKVLTPSLKSGCVHGIMRKQVIEICAEMGYSVEETEKLTEHDLLHMDEIFLTNAVVGLKYVSGFKNRRYYNKNSKKIINKLNETAF